MKNNFIQIRVTAEEKVLFKEKADKAGVSLTKYIKECVSKKRLVNSQLLLSLIREINRIGCNINQATKIMNTYHTYDDTDYNYIYREFMELKEKVDEFINKENAKRNGNS